MGIRPCLGEMSGAWCHNLHMCVSLSPVLYAVQLPPVLYAVQLPPVLLPLPVSWVQMQSYLPYGPCPSGLPDVALVRTPIRKEAELCDMDE